MCHLSFTLFYLLMIISPSTSAFLHSVPAVGMSHPSPSSTVNVNGQGFISRFTVALNESRDGETRDQRERARPRRRNAADTPSSSTVNPSSTSRSKTGLRHVCPPLDGAVGAPPLPVLTTKDPRTIERWLEENVYSDNNEYKILGFDLESIAKPPWKPDRASLPDGPATLQLSTPTSCIIIQLSRCGDGSAMYAPAILRTIINNPKIIKVGVGIDDDALELYRWSKSSSSGNARDNNNWRHPQQTTQFWEMTSRFDIGCILPNTNPSRRSGIRELAQTILGVEINKSKVRVNVLPICFISQIAENNYFASLSIICFICFTYSLEETIDEQLGQSPFNPRTNLLCSS
jgi:hypothetical protein